MACFWDNLHGVTQVCPGGTTWEYYFTGPLVEWSNGNSTVWNHGIDGFVAIATKGSDETASAEPYWDLVMPGEHAESYSDTAGGFTIGDDVFTAWLPDGRLPTGATIHANNESPPPTQGTIASFRYNLSDPSAPYNDYTNTDYAGTLLFSPYAIRFQYIKATGDIKVYVVDGGTPNLLFTIADVDGLLTGISVRPAVFGAYAKTTGDFTGWV